MTDLRQFYFFENLSDAQIQTLSSFTIQKKMSKDTILFYEKDTPTTLTFLTEGILKVYKTDQKNNEIVMHRFQPGSLIAEMAVFEGMPYPASAAFETDGSVIEIDFNKFKNSCLHDPEISLLFFKSLTAKIRYLENVIALNLVLDSTARLAKYICEHPEEVNTLKHYQLASQLHMTPETLSRTFKKFTTLGLVEKDSDGYAIKHLEGLEVLFE